MASNDGTSNIVRPITTNYRFEDSNGHTRYCWTPSQQGLLKSALFIGYVILQVSGGSLSERFGTKIVLGISALSSSLLTLATPIASNLNYWAIFAIRFLIGLSLSVTYPAIPPLIQKWVPEQEKSMWLSCVIVGGSFGTVVAFPLCGFILDQLDWEVCTQCGKFRNSDSLSVIFYVKSK